MIDFTCKSSVLQAKRDKEMMRKFFCKFKEQWYQSTVSSLRHKLGAFPNLWRISNIAEVRNLNL